MSIIAGKHVLKVLLTKQLKTQLLCEIVVLQTTHDCYFLVATGDLLMKVKYYKLSTTPHTGQCIAYKPYRHTYTPIHCYLWHMCTGLYHTYVCMYSIGGDYGNFKPYYTFEEMKSSQIYHQIMDDSKAGF